MTPRRNRYQTLFDFLVEVSGGAADGPHAGFEHLRIGGADIAAAQWLHRVERADNVTKITGLNKATDVTMKRGVISAPTLCQWLEEIRNGDQAARRTVLIHLQNQHRTAVAHTWKLLGARIIKHVSGPLDAEGAEVAMEELTLTWARLEAK